MSDSTPAGNKSGSEVESAPDQPPRRLTKTARELLIGERGGECEMCARAPSDDTDVSLEVHHRRPLSEGGDNDPTNLIVLCQRCHRRHHGNQDSEAAYQQLGLDETDVAPDTTESVAVDSDDSASELEQGDEDMPDETLPPQQDPGEHDSTILQFVETQGPSRTGLIAEHVGLSGEQTRRISWKLAGEGLLARRQDGTWDIVERVSDEDNAHEEFPKKPKTAYRAGRDEVIRQMAADGMPESEIVEVTDLSRNTVTRAINRARVRELTDDVVEIDEATADIETVSEQLRQIARTLDPGSVTDDR